jgi:cytochrome P450
MQRVRAVTGHIVSHPTAAAVADTTEEPVQAPPPTQEAVQDQRPGGVALSLGGNLSDEEKMTLMRTLMEYNESSRKFVADGTFPDMSIFDLGLATKFELGLLGEQEACTMLDVAEAAGRLEILNKLPGPWQSCANRSEQAALINEMVMTDKHGNNVFQFAEWQLQYGKNGLSSNIVVPHVFAYKSPSGIYPRVILADPEDAERIARTHVRKEGNFKPILYNSLIATDDNDHWIQQRRAISDLFLPLSSLAEILPVSLSRAKQCAARLAGLASGGAAVDMSDFLLHEAQAQLQLALLGCPEELMEATNEDIRAVFAGDFEKAKIGAIGSAMKSIMEHAGQDQTLAAPGDGRPIKGPLSRGVQSSDLSPADNYGNMLLVLFAGHDTTGHTMTWLMLELARNPELQRKLQLSIDSFFEELDGRDPTYRDLASDNLDLLDRCITETLRLWPAVANGTFRQLQFADEVKGKDGEPVMLPKGTPIMITNWQRHRNEVLWGPDVNSFNPYRNFTRAELARVGGPLAAMNPQSGRFSPFAHNPRSCLGKNFAQMEMRLIIAYLLRGFDFSLSAPYDSLANKANPPAPGVHDFRGVNRGTMGPMDLENSLACSWGTRYQYALKLHPKPRTE